MQESSVRPATVTDAAGRQWRTHKDKIETVADIMNSQSIHPLQTSDELFHIFDAALTTAEIDFLAAMGGGSHTLETLKKAVSLPDEQFNTLLESLIYKGPVAIIRDDEGNRVYHIMTIFPGWFEFYMMRGVDDPDHRLFAERIEKMYTAAYDFGNEEVINELVMEVGPHLAVAPMESPRGETVTVGEKLIPENHVYATSSITSIFANLDESEFISVGYCLCRFEKELIGDHCREDMPMETCISIGPAAEHLIEQGISRQLTKSEALAMISDWQDRGCIHQTGRTIPLKDFKSKYPVDVICNCCWDCCGVIGNYNRGYLPLTVTSYYRATIPDTSTCTACGVCVDYCPVGIISLHDDGMAVINNDLCIGCGQCLHHCSFGAIELVPDKRVVFLPMLGRDRARIAPPESLMAEHEPDEMKDALRSDRDEVLRVLEETRLKMTRPDIAKVFSKWNKTFLYEFTDLGEFWTFTVTGGVPGPLKQEKVDSPDIHYILTGAVFVGLMRKEIDGFKAFRNKLVKVKAPVMDLVKLQKLIG